MSVFTSPLSAKFHNAYALLKHFTLQNNPVPTLRAFKNQVTEDLVKASLEFPQKQAILRVGEGHRGDGESGVVNKDRKCKSRRAKNTFL